MDKKTESTEAGKHADMGIKTVSGQDSEGHFPGSKQAEFSEQRAQEDQTHEDENELNQTDARETARGTESI
ncbi:MAG TPA: hypothetical protein VGB71_08355 [Flavisolibacter sp.]|jgi:hypothetical protein